MELSEIPVWQYIATVWASTWILVVGRTWTQVKWELEVRYPRHPIVAQPVLHFMVYCVSINLILPLMGIQVVLSDTTRDKWVYAYAKAVGSKKPIKK